jgi:hypothetical protein
MSGFRWPDDLRQSWKEYPERADLEYFDVAATNTTTFTELLKITTSKLIEGVD